MTFQTKEEEPCLQVTQKEIGSPGRIRTSNISVNSLETKFMTICRGRDKSRGFSKFRQNGTSQIHLLFSVLVLHLPRFITGCMTLP
jgi:hypothetical protein